MHITYICVLSIQKCKPIELTNSVDCFSEQVSFPQSTVYVLHPIIDFKKEYEDKTSDMNKTYTETNQDPWKMSSEKELISTSFLICWPAWSPLGAKARAVKKLATALSPGCRSSREIKLKHKLEMASQKWDFF